MVMLLMTSLIWAAVSCSPEDNTKLCTRDSECPSEHRCQQNRCQPIDDSCVTDSDCFGGKYCIRNRCQFLLCQDDRDCQNHESCQGGQCAPKPQEPIAQSEKMADTHTSTPDGGQTDLTPPLPDQQPSSDTHQPERPPEPSPRICQPNRDGIIQRNEMMFEVGSSVIYSEVGSETQPVTVDLVGKTDAQGKQIWDFSGEYPGSARVIDELISPKGTWYESHFPDATYASLLDRSLGLLGVFQVTDSALLMLGTVSSKTNYTRISYSTAIDLFRFPLRPGESWTVTTTASGTFGGAIYRSDETYTFEVDAKGDVITPQGTFSALRVRLRLTQQQSLPVPLYRSRYSYYFVAECYGIIAMLNSQYYENNALFTKAALLKRLDR